MTSNETEFKISQIIGIFKLDGIILKDTDLLANIIDGDIDSESIKNKLIEKYKDNNNERNI